MTTWVIYIYSTKVYLACCNYVNAIFEVFVKVQVNGPLPKRKGASQSIRRTPPDNQPQTRYHVTSRCENPATYTAANRMDWKASQIARTVIIQISLNPRSTHNIVMAYPV